MTGGGLGGVGSNDPGSLSVVLEEALGRAQVEVQSLVARIGQIELSHWEIARGLSGVERARGHLGSLIKVSRFFSSKSPSCSRVTLLPVACWQELQSGRHSVALVLASEMAALMDTPTSSSSSSSSSSRGAKQQQFVVGTSSAPAPPLDTCKVAEDLKSARQIFLELASSAKTSEAMLAGLAESLPGWFQLIKAESKSRYRQELSKIRAVVDSKLQVLRKELKELRDSVSTELRSASTQLLSLSSAALVASSSSSDVPLASVPGFAVQMSSMIMDGSLNAALSADLAASGRPGGGEGAFIPSTALPSASHSSASAHHKLDSGLLAQLDVERRAMAKGLEGLVSELGACLSGGEGGTLTSSHHDKGAAFSHHDKGAVHSSPRKGSAVEGGGMLAGPVQNLEVRLSVSLLLSTFLLALVDSVLSLYSWSHPYCLTGSHQVREVRSCIA
jgi:hypothetical protein